MIDRVARRFERAAEASEQRAEREDAGEQPFLIDAERGDHVPVLRRRAHQHAPAGAMQDEPKKPEHDRTQNDQKEIVRGKPLSDHHDRARKSRSARREQVVGSPDQEHEVLDDQGRAESRE